MLLIVASVRPATELIDGINWPLPPTHYRVVPPTHYRVVLPDRAPLAHVNACHKLVQYRPGIEPGTFGFRPPHKYVAHKFIIDFNRLKFVV